MAGVCCSVECVSELGPLWPRTGEEDKVSTGEGDRDLSHSALCSSRPQMSLSGRWLSRDKDSWVEETVLAGVWAGPSWSQQPVVVTPSALAPVSTVTYREGHCVPWSWTPPPNPTVTPGGPAPPVPEGLDHRNRDFPLMGTIWGPLL